MEFETHSVNARKDLLHFIEEHTKINPYEEIGKNPKAWLDELNLIYGELTRTSLSGVQGMHMPPTEDPEFRKLGENVFLYRGEKGPLRGLWIREKVENAKNEAYNWARYSIGLRAKLRINDEFSGISIENFLPENFEKIGKVVQKQDDEGVLRPTKRPILTFEILTRAGPLGVYAKGSETQLSFFYDYAKPGYRLTPFSSIHKCSSKREMEISFELGALGVNVPKVMGYYESTIEDFLFVEKVEGDNPQKFLPKSKRTIIKQDAEMLAAICLAGYRKQGFTDFDDKIFDEQKLYLIDVEECVNLYSFLGFDFRELLLNPNDRKLTEFRKMQRKIFEDRLKDAIFNYRDTLIPDPETKASYIKAFYRRIGWKKPSEKEICRLTTFERDYMTTDRRVSIACDTD